MQITGMEENSMCYNIHQFLQKNTVKNEAAGERPEESESWERH